MRTLHIVFHLLFSILTLFPTPLFAEAPLDFNGDGLTDYLTTTSATNLTWNGQSSLSNNDATVAQDLGLAGDAPAPGYWLSPETPSLAIVQLEASSLNYVWKVALSAHEIQRRTFGKKGDLILIGGDYDGDGLTDGALVRTEGTKLVWYVQLKMFTDAARTVKISLGKLGDKTFFANPDGTHDWIGIIAKNTNGKGVIQLAEVTSKGKRKKTYKNVPSVFLKSTRPRPIPLASESGADYLGVTTADRSDTTLRIYTLKGKKIAQITLTGLGSAISGEFSSEDAGEEIVFVSGTSAVVFNPISRITDSGTLTNTNLLGRLIATAPSGG